MMAPTPSPLCGTHGAWIIGRKWLDNGKMSTDTAGKQTSQWGRAQMLSWLPWRTEIQLGMGKWGRLFKGLELSLLQLPQLPATLDGDPRYAG